MLYGPLCHRLLHGHAPLDDRFVRAVIDMALDGIAPGDRVRSRLTSTRFADPLSAGIAGSELVVFHD